MDFRPVLHVVGALLCILSASMCIPMLVDLYANNIDWQIFMICIATTLFFGGTLMLTNQGTVNEELTVRQAFVLTALSWVSMAGFGALPIWLSHEHITFTDAFFESMSGITTTGSTVLTGLDDMPPGLLIWRSIMNWLGGIGFILMAILVLPFLKVGGMQLFRTESSDRSEKAVPRLQHLTVMTGFVYLFITGLCAASYWSAGMGGFDSINHAMTTVSTGGFSTKDASFAGYDNSILLIAGGFMILGSLPFVLFVSALSGNIAPFLRNTQIRVFILMIFIALSAITLWLTLEGIMPFADATAHAFFNVASIMSTTGFASDDYMQWGAFPIAIFAVIMFFGGCTGSTSGGIKIMRFEIMAHVLHRHLHKLIQPNAVIPLRYEGRTVSDDVAYSVLVFVFGFLVCFGSMTLALGMTGLDLVTAVSAAAAALTNVGLGLGDIIGPAGNFSSLPDAAKWLLSFGMLLGRLELFTVLILFMPGFWKR